MAPLSRDGLVEIPPTSSVFPSALAKLTRSGNGAPPSEAAETGAPKAAEIAMLNAASLKSRKAAPASRSAIEPERRSIAAARISVRFSFSAARLASPDIRREWR